MVYLVIAAAVLIVIEAAVQVAQVEGTGMTQYSAKIQAFAAAIAVAEGFGIAGAIPTICHNPGDLTQGDFGDTAVYRTASGGQQIIVFAIDADGWNALYTKLQNIVNGTSSVYNLGMTIAQMAQRFEGESSFMSWASNVADQLGASVNDAIGGLLT